MKLCSGSMNSRTVMNQTQGTLARRTPNDVLRQALVAPEILGNLQLSEWDGLLPEARSAGLLARLDVLLNERRLFKGVPDPVKPHLIAARRVASNEDAIVRWEVNRIAHALARQDIPIVLLKGAAYVMWELPVARGRFSSDVDILVPKASIANVEKALVDHGWRHIKLDDYDQFFYRHWSHELPPLQHHDRGTIVDVHHTILPPTGRLHPDPAKLLAASVPLTGTRFSVLAPADMVLHSAAHAFQDGDLTRGLRDLVDVDDLLRHFSAAHAGFWDNLAYRAEELDLSRPLYYALRWAKLYLQTPVPACTVARSKAWRPTWPASFLMDAIVDRVITAGPLDKDLILKSFRRLVYARAHWLRMPPNLLIPHLVRKALRRCRTGDFA
jgi:Uncharacterised nucleotidyltransferase